MATTPGSFSFLFLFFTGPYDKYRRIKEEKKRTMFALQHRRRVSIYENIFVFFMREKRKEGRKEEEKGARKKVSSCGLRRPALIVYIYTGIERAAFPASSGTY